MRLWLSICLLVVLGGCHLAVPYGPRADGSVADSTNGAPPDAETPQGSPGPDAAPADTTSTDAEPADAEPGALCDRTITGLLFCDGFEDPTLAPWDLLQEKGQLRHETTRVASGSGALHAESTAGYARVAAFPPTFGPLTGGSVHVRASLYLPVAPRQAQATVVWLGDSAYPNEHVTVVVHEDVAGLWFDGPKLWIDATRPLPTGRWVCVQLEVRISATDGAVTLRFDGEQVAHQRGFDTLAGQPGIDTLGVGLPWTMDVTEPLQVWVDDVAIGTEPIPCE